MKSQHLSLPLPAQAERNKIRFFVKPHKTKNYETKRNPCLYGSGSRSYRARIRQSASHLRTPQTVGRDVRMDQQTTAQKQASMKGKAMLKSELAREAGVDRSTLRRWLKTDEEVLRQMGVSKTTHLLPPQAVKYLREKYAI